MINFTDRIKLSLYSGDGGNGIISFRREKFIPKGGPDGGDGGDGGDILIVAKRNRSNLYHLRSHRIVRSNNGAKGGPARLTGARGSPRILEVPQGTLIKTMQDVLIHDFKEFDQPFKILAGGKGGRGNHHFRSSVNKAPRTAEAGTPGREIDILLELKLIADVGFAGLPNAGKSTLLATLTNATPKTAAYPFTTLSPNLGMFVLDHLHALVLADIPGLIEGAHQGKGLGIDFLRHIERTQALLFLLDGASTTPTPAEAFRILRTEMAAYSPAMLEKPFFLAISKYDLFSQSPTQKNDIIQSFEPDIRDSILFMSSYTHFGMDVLKQRLLDMHRRLISAQKPDLTDNKK